MEDGVLALILLAAFVALGRFAAEVYAANPVQRVSIVAMVVAAPFWLWALYNTVFDSAWTWASSVWRWRAWPASTASNSFRRSGPAGAPWWSRASRR